MKCKCKRDCNLRCRGECGCNKCHLGLSTQMERELQILSSRCINNPATGYKCAACNEQFVTIPYGLCGRCLEGAKYNEDTPITVIIGLLMEGQFYCMDCANWWSDIGIRVTKAEIGDKSQMCVCCHVVIVRGVLPYNALACNKCRAVPMGF